MEFDLFSKWDRASEALEIPNEVCSPEIRIITDDLISSSYTFGLIYNPFRYERPVNFKVEGCYLCEAVNQVKNNYGRVILESDNFIVTPNLYPVARGSSIAFSKFTDSQEISMYRTSNLEGFVEVLEEYFKISRETGFQIFRNSPGAGASIPEHEHCNFHCVEYLSKLAGKKYGFEDAEIEDTCIEGVKSVFNFPFANLVFEEDSERIVCFLKKIDEKYGSRFNGRGVPYGISQGVSGILVVPVKKYIEGKGIGAGDMAGHLLCGNEREFRNAGWEYCVNRLEQTLFRKGDIDLVGLL